MGRNRRNSGGHSDRNSVVAAAYYAFTQVKEARQDRLLNIIISLRHDIDSTESRQNRYALFNELPDDLTTSLTAEQDQVVDRVVVEYDNIGSLVINGFIEFDLDSQSLWEQYRTFLEED